MAGETSDWKLETTAAADGGGDWDDEGRARAGVKSDWRGHGLRQSAAANTNQQQQHNVMYVESGLCRTAPMYGMESNIGQFSPRISCAL